MPDKHHTASIENIVNEISTRRGFFKRAAATAIAGGAVAACKDGAPESAGSSCPAATPVVSAASAAETMDKMHEAGIKAFPAKTAGKGNQPFAPRIEKGVKIYELTAEKIQWETAPGQKVEAWAYNGQVPGPQIRFEKATACV
jgi:FtsP/CotA-like multicopper oxidase with cupredoxin domain